MSTGTRIEYDNQWLKPLPNSRSTSTQIHYEPTEGDPFQPGTKVMHPTFGPGKILTREGQGEDSKVTVFFQGHGQKKLLLRFAKLNPLP